MLSRQLRGGSTSRQNCSHGGGEGGAAGGGANGGQKPGRHGGLGGGDGGAWRPTWSRVHISHLSEMVQRGKWLAVYEAFVLRSASSQAMQKSPNRHRGGVGIVPQSSAQSGESN